MDDPFARLSRAIARKPWLVVGVWVVLLLACAALWPRAETVVKTSGFELPDTQAARAGAVLDREFGPSAGRGAVVVYHSAIRTVDSGAYRRDVVASTARIRGIGAVRSILTFFNTGDPSLVSRDRHTTLALVDFKSDDDPTVIAAVRQRLRHLSVSADVTGNLAIQQDTFSTSQDDLRRFEIIAMPVLLILLVVVFRTVVAASMPLVLGACSVTMATALIALVGSLFDVSVFALNVASMIGLGLGIDFSLVLISRFRQEMAAGLRPDEALPRTMATAGRSVTFSAITVMLCMLVMTLFMHDFMILRSISMGVMLVAFTSILAALTLLPAVLSLLGHRIEALPVLRLRRRAARGGPGAWYRLSHAIMRRPWSWLAMALLLLAVLALPARDLRTEVETTGALPGTAESARGAQLIGDAFGPGRLTPI
ncbi:MAG: MMPL family transporter, partial [Chloroflexi bacterium]|nr:MMPL family transporter [Chloroflexota bacterium]